MAAPYGINFLLFARIGFVFMGVALRKISFDGRLRLRPSRFDSRRFAISCPLKSAHLKYPTHHDPFLTPSFTSPFRFIRSSLRGAIAPTRHSVGGGRKKNRVPCCQPAF